MKKYFDEMRLFRDRRKPGPVRKASGLELIQNGVDPESQRHRLQTDALPINEQP